MSEKAQSERPRDTDVPPERMPFEVRNPRYAGATPEDVARRLFKPVRRKEPRNEQR